MVLTGQVCQNGLSMQTWRHFISVLSDWNSCHFLFFCLSCHWHHVNHLCLFTTKNIPEILAQVLGMLEKKRQKTKSDEAVYLGISQRLLVLHKKPALAAWNTKGIPKQTVRKADRGQQKGQLPPAQGERAPKIGLSLHVIYCGGRFQLTLSWALLKLSAAMQAVHSIVKVLHRRVGWSGVNGQSQVHVKVQAGWSWISGIRLRVTGQWHYLAISFD